MVNSPKIRHSKPTRDPVTIDLDAEPAKTGDGPKTDPSATSELSPTSSAAAAATSSATATSPGTSSAAPSGSAAKSPGETSTSDPASAKPASSSGSFGRDASTGSVPRSTPATPPPPDKPSAKSPPPASAAPRRGGVSAIAAGLIGGVVALAGAGALQYAGVLPTFGTSTVSTDVDGLRSELAALRDQVSVPPADTATPRLDELSAALAETRTELEALRSSGAQTAETDGTLDARIVALESALAAVQQGSAQVDLAPVTERLDALDASVAEARQVAQGATAPLEERIAGLETKLDALTGQVAEQAEQPNAALAISASALKSTIDRGEPFMTELETYASIAPASPEIESLRGMAATGVPARTAIADDFPSAANAMIAAARSEDPNAGFMDRLMSSAQSLVQVRPVGMVEGEGADAIVARLEVALGRGDYAGVVSEYETLPEPAKAAGAEFIAKVKARQAADGLIESILSTALKS